MRYFIKGNIDSIIDLLDSKINVLLNTKTKAASVTEVPPKQLIFLHLQATLEKLHCFLTSDSDIACNLFITSDPEGTDSVPRCSSRNHGLHQYNQMGRSIMITRPYSQH